MKRIKTVLCIVGILGMLVSCAQLSSVEQKKRQDLTAAAEGGDVVAQYELGKSFCCGYGPGKSTANALHWYCRSALQGYGPAQYALGRHYGTRADTSYDPSLRQELIYSYMWYSIAALQNVPLADAERDALANDMSARELREASDHVRNWQTQGCR